MTLFRKLCTKLYIETTLNIPREVATKLIHFVAFYWIDGPWARCWNVYNYDPRISPEAAILQTIDHRRSSRVKNKETHRNV